MKAVESSKKKIWQSLAAIVLLLCLAAGIALAKPVQSEAASGQYLIKVNKQMNTVTIYQQDSNGKYQPYKAFICSCGYATPLGTFHLQAHYRWKLMYQEVYAQYASRITTGILFHSVWYYKQDASTLSAVQYNKLGRWASHGCVRLTAADAKWIFDNCAVGTKIVIYNSSKTSKLGKPESIPVPTSTGYDPSDIWTKSNPWNSKKPKLYGVKDQTVKFGSTVKLLSGVTAKGTTGFKLASKYIKTTGTVDTSTPGQYKIVYTATDQIGRSVKKTAVFTVLPDTEAPFFTGIDDVRYVNYTGTVDRDYVMTGVKAYDKTAEMKSSAIQVTITQTDATHYTVVYSATASNGYSSTKTMQLVIDTGAPTISGVVDYQMTQSEFAALLDENQNLNQTAFVAHLTVTDDVETLQNTDVTLTWSYLNEEKTEVAVVYNLKDKAGNAAAPVTGYVHLTADPVTTDTTTDTTNTTSNTTTNP